MKDHEKSSWREFQGLRQASLQAQLLKTRESLNKAKYFPLPKEELDILEKRESTLLEKLTEIIIEPRKHDFDAEYSFIEIVPHLECDLCHKEIEYGVPRYHCTENPNYDICTACFPTSGHPHPTYVEKYDTTAHNKRTARATSLAEVIFTAFQCYLERPCLGQKMGATFEWMPYKEVYKKAMNIGTAIRNKFSLLIGDAVVIHSRNSVEWICTDLGCLMNGLLVVPIHHVVQDEPSLSYIITNCNIKCVFCEEESISLFSKIRDTIRPDLRIVVYGESRKSDEAGIERFSDLEDFGATQEFNVHPRSRDDIVTIIHTSGSTGKPKGAPFTDKSCRDHIISSFSSNDPAVEICFEPLAHISEREYMHDIICSGGRVGLLHVSDNLFEDIAFVGPCSISTTPRLWNVLHSKYQQALYLEQSLAPPEEAEEIKKKVLGRFKGVLGKRIRSVGCGGALPSPALMQFLEECFGQGVASEGYGSTEAGSIAGKGGHLVSGVQIQLVDVPELGYFGTDQPYPRGELYVKTGTMISGYYNNEEDTKRLFVDGWFCTGDIVERLEERRIRIIDRRKNFFKLSQGEYVAAETVENTLLASSYVDQIFVTCGDLAKFEQNAVFAIVVPHWHLVQESAAKIGIHGSNEELANNPEIIKLIIKSLQDVGQRAKLAPYEIPSNIIVEPHVFTVENGKMTASNKLARPILEKFYREAVNAKLEEEKSKSQEALLLDILQDILGLQIASSELNQNSSLSEFGGDSLSAVKFSSMLSNKLQLNIPPHILLDKSTTIATLAQLIKNGGKEMSLPINKDLLAEITQDAVLDPDFISKQEIYHPQSISHVLLTGSTGFVGCFLLQQLLRATDYTIYCLVRPSSNSTCLERLQNILHHARVWEGLSEKEKEIVVVEGDFAKPRFGLEQTEYDALANKIDLVFHCGAVVNHVLPYSEMKRENVVGTLEVIKFCANSRNPRFNFVSTISCIPSVPASSSKQAILNYVTHDMGGYEQTKFVAERLVEQAIERKVVIGSIFRLGMVGWNSVTGVGNPKDWLFILFAGISLLQKYPDSSAEFEMLPVDSVSEALLKLGTVENTVGSTIDICGNELIPFRALASLVSNAKPLPFTEWRDYLFQQLKTSDDKSRKIFDGLLLFSEGLPDERKFRKEIEERSEALSKFGISPPSSLLLHCVEKYFKFIEMYQQ